MYLRYLHHISKSQGFLASVSASSDDEMSARSYN